MSTPFIHPDVFLDTPRAVTLFHDYAEAMPIIDYHCHLSPRAIAENKRFTTVVEPWLEGDHYKWRAMRACGVNERFITGQAPAREKFQRWAETVPKTLRNPLYHWTHLELARPFGITDRLLGPETAESIWAECNEKLNSPEFSVRGILRQMRVEIVCTTDDPIDSLEFHSMMRADSSMPLRVFPAFRADKAMAVDDPGSYCLYLEKLGIAAGIHIHSFATLVDALSQRHAFFHSQGCRLSDHGLEEIYTDEWTSDEVERSFDSLLTRRALGASEARKVKSAILRELARMDAERGWVQQFHLGALRNTNHRMLRTLGPDTGYDSIGDRSMAESMARFFDGLNNDGILAKTIVYNLNPSDNELFATMIGNFQDGTIPGKMQYGSAWWFLDQMDGMTRQIEALSTMGVLSQFVGMLTDSRSFLSFPRHEYFRRLLCNILGNDMTRGMIPDDMDLVGGMVRDICYQNARRYFAFPDAEVSSTHGTAHSSTKGR